MTVLRLNFLPNGTMDGTVWHGSFLGFQVRRKLVGDGIFGVHQLCTHLRICRFLLWNFSSISTQE